MKIPSNSLAAFLEVARARHFTRAAKSLGLTQSALSQRILNLEELLGTALFVRDRAGPRLTPAGERLLRHAQILETLEDELLHPEPGLRGSVRVAGFSSVVRSIALPALAPLLRQHPLPCTVFTRELADLPDLLRRGEADFILHDRELSRDGIESTLLGHEEYLLVRAAKAKALPFFLDHDAEDEITARYFRGTKGKDPVRERRYLDDVYGLLDGVKLGLGQAVLPRHLIKNEKDLETVNPGKVLRTEVWLCHPAQAFYTPLQKAVKEALVAGFRAALGPSPKA